MLLKVCSGYNALILKQFNRCSMWGSMYFCDYIFWNVNSFVIIGVIDGVAIRAKLTQGNGRGTCCWSTHIFSKHMLLL